MVAERTETPVRKLKVTEALSKDVGRAIAREAPYARASPCRPSRASR